MVRFLSRGSFHRASEDRPASTRGFELGFGGHCSRPPRQRGFARHRRGFFFWAPAWQWQQPQTRRAKRGEDADRRPIVAEKRWCRGDVCQSSRTCLFAPEGLSLHRAIMVPAWHMKSPKSDPTVRLITLRRKAPKYRASLTRRRPRSRRRRPWCLASRRPVFDLAFLQPRSEMTTRCGTPISSIGKHRAGRSPVVEHTSIPGCSVVQAVGAPERPRNGRSRWGRSPP